MQVKLLQAAVGAIVGKLNFHLKVAVGDRSLAHRAQHPDAGAAPSPIRGAPWEAIHSDQLTDSVTEDRFVLHLAARGPERASCDRREYPRQMLGSLTTVTSYPATPW
jgi:hypothetical protein